MLATVDTRNTRTGTALNGSYLAALAENYPKEGDLKQTIFFINADTHDQEDVANGSLGIFHPSAVVHPDSMPASMFEHIVVVPIQDHASKPNGWRDSDFEGPQARAALEKAVQQYAGNGPSLHKRDTTTNMDNDVWSPELGQVGAFAGIYKKMRANLRDADYYIVVKSGAERACQELKEQLAVKGDELTFGQLLQDPAVSYVNAVSLRNCKRMAYNIAEAMGLPIVPVVDVSAYAPTLYAAKPFRAEPTAPAPKRGFQQSISSIHPVTWKGEEHVGIFHCVRPVNEAIEHNIVIANPYDGLHLFHMEKKPLGYAVPVDTGLARPLAEANILHPDTAARHRNVSWEGPQTAIKALAPNVNHEVDSEFYRAMHQYGWLQQGRNTVSQMVPVLLKVSNADLKRSE